MQKKVKISETQGRALGSRFIKYRDSEEKSTTVPYGKTWQSKGQAKQKIAELPGWDITPAIPAF